MRRGLFRIGRLIVGWVLVVVGAVTAPTPLPIGWLLLIPVYWVYIKVSERIDEEIAESVVEFDTAEADAPSGQPASQPEGGAE